MKDFPPNIPLPGDVAPNGYPLLKSVQVEPGRPSDIRGYDRPASCSDPAPEMCLALIDTGADTCSITADLKERLDLRPQWGKIIEGGYGGQTSELDAYSIFITIGGVFRCQLRVAAVMVPKKNYGYQIIIGCNVLQHCKISYGTDTGDDRTFTLHVPRAVGLV